MLHTSRTKLGFTLIEMLVVISIIALAVGVLSSALTNARENGRDKERIANLAQLEFALNTYREANNEYPNYPDGIIFGQGGGLDLLLTPYVEGTVADPLNDADHHLFYDSAFDCNDESYVVLLATAMERSDNSNIQTECDDTGGFPDAYIFLIAGPLVDGSTNYVNEQDEGNWWETNSNNYDWFCEQYLSYGGTDCSI